MDAPASAGVRVRPVGRLGVTVIAFVTLSVLANAAGAVADWHTFLVVRDYLGFAHGVSEADLGAADELSREVARFGLAATLAAGTTFLVWLWRARLNAELCGRRHRYRRGWTLAVWFCPLLNLWAPRQVVADIWRGSAPAGAVGTAGRRLLSAWWLAWVGAGLIDLALLGAFTRQAPTLQSLRMTALLASVSCVAYTLAAALVAVIVRRISCWQEHLGLTP